MIVPLLLDLPSRDAAQEAARRELSRPGYEQAQPSWLERVLYWLYDQLQALLSRASDAVPGGPWGLLALTAVIAGLVAVVVTRIRPSRQVRTNALFDSDTVLTAAAHRSLAEQAAAAGDYLQAVTERFRAIVRELTERGVVDAGPGSTASEVARAAGAAVPLVAEPLRSAAGLFEQVRYGAGAATEQAYARLVVLDQQITDSALVVR